MLLLKIYLIFIHLHSLIHLNRQLLSPISDSGVDEYISFNCDRLELIFYQTTLHTYQPMADAQCHIVSFVIFTPMIVELESLYQ